jgi:uncharacterized protein YndB with AHSA1/START domain
MSSANFEIVSTRVFKTSQEQLFKAWTDPSILANWWGPKGFTNTFHEYDLRAGGKWNFTMHGPNGANFDNRCIFIYIEPNKQLVWHHLPGPEFYIVTTFDVMEKGTLLTFQMVFPDAAMLEKIKEIVVPSNEENFDRLEQELLKMQA